MKFDFIGKDQYGMDIVPCHIVEMEESLNGDVFARFEIKYTTNEIEHGIEKIKQRRFKAWGKLKPYDAFFILQEFGIRHNVKIQILNALKPTNKNYKLAIKASEYFSKKCHSVYLAHIMYKNDEFWAPFEGKIKFSKVPTKTLMEYIKNEY